MKKFTHLLFGIALLALSSTSQAIMLGFSPVSHEATLGDSVDVALTISGLGDYMPDSLGAFDIDVSFDSSLLNFTGVSYGDPVLGDQLDIFGLGSLTITTPGLGLITLAQVSLDLTTDLNALQAGSFTLATLTFDTLAIGTSPLDIGSIILSDAGGGRLEAAVSQGFVTVATSVPEPGSMFLMGSALIGLLGYRRMTQ